MSGKNGRIPIYAGLFDPEDLNLWGKIWFHGRKMRAQTGISDPQRHIHIRSGPFGQADFCAENQRDSVSRRANLQAGCFQGRFS
jgi:hypothetical protein